MEINSGSKFVRADMHIHSYGSGGSFDVRDESMTPLNIVDTALANNLSIISITDHNEIENAKTAADYAKDKSILFVPGIEVSTTQGHLLVYFSSYIELRQFYGNLTISNEKQICSQGIAECLDIADSYGGFGILAHIELESGFEKTVSKFGPHMEPIFCHKNLMALEISKKDSVNLYTEQEIQSDAINEGRMALVKKRREVLDLDEASLLPKVMFSDSHALDKLGINAEGDKKLTRFKVDELTFEALKIALQLHESRVRVEDLIPERVPRFKALKFKGGLLDGQEIEFSSNLTCIIGGRGTGKSTLVETLCSTSGNESTKDIVDSEVWPDEISLIYEDETGKVTEFVRSKNAMHFNVTDGYEGLAKIPLEYYGQGDASKTLEKGDDDPKALLNFLDTFLEIENLKEEDANLCGQLRNNQSESGKIRLEIAAIPEVKRQILILKGKKKRLEQDKVSDLVTYQTALIREKNLRDDLKSHLSNLTKNYQDILSDTTFFEHISNFPDDEIVVGKDQFVEVKKIVAEFSGIVESKSEELNSDLTQKITALNKQLEAWSGKEKDIQVKIDEKKEELEKAGVPFDIGKINQIASDLDHYEGKLRNLEADEKKLSALVKERKELIESRKEIKSKIYRERFLFGRSVNENLKNAVDGLFVSVSYQEGCFSPDFEQSIKQLMGWRTSQVSKAEMLARNMSPLSFTEAIKARRKDIFASLKDSSGGCVFNDGEIENLFEKINDNCNFEDFEALGYDDKPTITVTKIIERDGRKVNLTRSITKLSLGQQQSILLAILIQSKSDLPLLIDQPEDNLDSEFIYKTIVTNLRKIKEERQVIIVTHNANIAVLGDAELIIPLKSTNDRTSILSRGSIDRGEIRKECCSILEGGERAFLNRQRIYNLDT